MLLVFQVEGAVISWVEWARFQVRGILESVINLLVSKYQINLAFTILSSVLPTQLLRVLGL